MLRVLTLSTLFPNTAQPTFGVFVERQTRGLAGLPAVEVQVVAPIGLPPWPLSLHPHYRARTALPAREAWNGLPVYRPRFTVLPRLGEAGAAGRMASALLPLLRQIRETFPFDVIDAEFFWPDGPAAMRLAEALGVPYSVKARGADIQYWGFRPGVKEQVAEAGCRAGGILAVSEAMKQVMISLGLPGERIRVHYTGVDFDRFQPLDRAAAKAALGVGGPLFVTAGALIPRKGQRIVIEAMTRLADATLLLVGDGPDRGELERLARSRGVADRVRFLGSRPHAELPALLGAADAMLLPSSSEGLANVWVEALACGTPIVITDVGGAREVMDRPEAGALVDPSPEAIAAAARSLLKSPPAPDAIRAVAERFSWRRNAETLREHLASVVGR